MRAVFAGHANGRPELMQTTDYYPFGLIMAQQNFYADTITPNRYLYNGKELQNDVLAGTSLDWFDYGARMYDASLGRWHAVDPMMEIYNSYSPYAYVNNNPVNSFDPNGMYSMTFNGQEVSKRDKKYLQDYYGLPDDSEESDNKEQDPDKGIKKSLENSFSITRMVKDFFGIGLDPKNPQDQEKLQQVPERLEQTLIAIETANEVLMVIVPASSVAKLMADLEKGSGRAALAALPMVVVDVATMGKGNAAKGAGRVFWSSGGNEAVEAAARKFAIDNGMTTLLMTRAGENLKNF